MMIEREERERDRPDLIFILSLLLPTAAQIHFFSFSPSLSPSLQFQSPLFNAGVRSFSLVLGCCVIGRAERGRDGGPKEIIFCVRFPPSLPLSLFLPQLLNAGVHPSRAREREKGIVSPTLEHGEMKWPLLPLFSPSPASLRFNKL